VLVSKLLLFVYAFVLRDQKIASFRRINANRLRLCVLRRFILAGGGGGEATKTRAMVGVRSTTEVLNARFERRSSYNRRLSDDFRSRADGVSQKTACRQRNTLVPVFVVLVKKLCRIPSDRPLAEIAGGVESGDVIKTQVINSAFT